MTSPNSVLIKGEDGDAINMGVSYDVRLHVADSVDDYKGTKKASVNMSIRKVRARKISSTVPFQRGIDKENMGRNGSIFFSGA